MSPSTSKSSSTVLATATSDPTWIVTRTTSLHLEKSPA